MTRDSAHWIRLPNDGDTNPGCSRGPHSLLKLAMETCGALSATPRKTVKRAWVEIRYKHMVLGDVSHSSLEEEQRGRAHGEMAIHRLGRIMGCGAMQFVVAAFSGHRGIA
jgi:hypothetical protein